MPDLVASLGGFVKQGKRVPATAWAGTSAGYYRSYVERAPRLLIHGWPRRTQRAGNLPQLTDLRFWTDRAGEAAWRRFERQRRPRAKRSYEGERMRRMRHINYMRREHWKPTHRYRCDNWPGFRDIKRRIMPL